MIEEDGASILGKQLEESWKRYRKVLKRAKSGMTEESVHDLRVALRRLEAVVDLVPLFAPAEYTQRTRRQLERIRNRLSPLRDVQVQLLSVGDLTNTYPDLLKFQKSLSKRERALTRGLQRDIQARHAKLKPTFNAMFGKSRRRLRMFTATEMERTVAEGADKAYTALVEAMRSVDSHEVSTIHQARIAFKRFRYTIQAAQPILRGTSEAAVHRMHDFQVILGGIQDAQVLFDTLTRWGQKQKKRVQRGLAPVCEVIAQRRRDSIARFLAALDDIQTFWRPRLNERKLSAVPLRSTG